jgi:hypothetical protein
MLPSKSDPQATHLSAAYLYVFDHLCMLMHVVLHVQYLSCTATISNLWCTLFLLLCMSYTLQTCVQQALESELTTVRVQLAAALAEVEALKIK